MGNPEAQPIRSAVACLLIVGLLSGCTTTRVIRQGDAFSLERKAMLVTTNHPGIEITNARAEGDSIVALSPYANHGHMKLHFSDVKRITTKKRPDKPGLYALLGIAVGGAVGYLAGEDNASDALSSRGASAFVCGAWAGFCGLVYGTGIGQKEVFVFQPSEPTP